MCGDSVRLADAGMAFCATDGAICRGARTVVRLAPSIKYCDATSRIFLGMVEHIAEG